ncbi:hypothetical protein PUR29_03630 [Methylobacterium ajmalii]|uniref:Uncharacterized protein n=1 Tax=Methylobacterium ajmalii TaxID=2738439 RepID=A0ABU9ZNU7_9HYPH
MSLQQADFIQIINVYRKVIAKVLCRLELSFSTAELKKMALSDAVATSFFGTCVAGKFKSLLSDMRIALSLGEVPQSPRIETRDQQLRMFYKISPNFELEIRPVSILFVGIDNWHRVHRVEIIGIHGNGADRL